MDELAQPTGLSAADVADRMARYGRNELPVKKATSPVTIFLRQFRSPFIYILLVAAVISFGLGQNINGYFILAVLVLNATIGTIQEYVAERAATALRDLVPSSARVMRDGRVQDVPSAEVVVDDIVLLESGDRIPADLVLLNSRDLIVDESMLTGESERILKQPMPLGADQPEDIQRCFAGTMANRGRATGRVTAVGQETEIGAIAKDVSAVDLVKPPLIARMEKFTLWVSIIMAIVIFIIFLVSLARGDDLSTVFLLGVALMVSAIPEGLPAAITVALAIGMRRMARANVIIRKLAAVESLGSCTYIASDKTGTLTVNRLTITQVVLPNGAAFAMDDDHKLVPTAQDDAFDHDAGIAALARSGALANEAELSDSDETPWSGDMVDVAFMMLAEKISDDLRHARATHTEIDSIPYESENAYSASLNELDEGVIINAKGALEAILPMCTETHGGEPIDPAKLTAEADRLAASGYRVLAVAGGLREAMEGDLHESLDGLQFLGLVGIIDPVRPEAVAALRECDEAQIKSVMVTGDHPLTALAIARELSLAGPEDKAITGAEIAAAQERSEAEVDELVHGHRVFARVTPVQKKMIVDRLIQAGHYVAVTGDGVNDAPALHHAHVGVAMGQRGTDVARESSDLILTDDNFASIVNGVREGRIVYNNIRKVIFLLISTGAAEITLFMWALFFAMPIPLLPLQLLWLNLVTNGVQDVALAFEPAEGDELKRAPRDPDQPVFDRVMIERVVTSALYMGTVAFALFWSIMQTGVPVEEARNVTLLLMVLFENVHALNSRSENQSVVNVPFFSNPVLLVGILVAQAIHIGSMYTPGINDLLQIEPVSFTLWLQLLGVALSLFIIDEGHKFLERRKARRVAMA
jgi:calcium-translocating P-type ATPase